MTVSSLDLLTIDEQIIQLSPSFNGSICKPRYVCTMTCEVRQLSLGQLHMWEHHIPVLSMPHKQWQGPVYRNETRDSILMQAVRSVEFKDYFTNKIRLSLE